jgi:low affinity Fe/Cu permease
MIEALDILTNVDEDIVLLHKHRSEFLTIQEATVNSLLSALKIVSKRLFKEIDGELAKLRDKRRSNFTKVYLNLIGTLTQPFAKACPRSTIDNIPIEIITNNVVGLEDYAINNMLAAVAYVHNTQTNTKEHHTYSVDPYISQRASNYQFKQNL